MSTRSNIYFVSDFHLGIDQNESASIDREYRFIAWLDHIKDDAQAIHIVGDLFDYWYEYREVVPKGYFRLFTKLHELTSQGIEIHYHIGNHDIWHDDYFSSCLGVQMHHEPQYVEYNNRRFRISHGDEMDTKWKYQLIRRILRNKISRTLYRLIHPDIGIRLMRYMSSRGRHKHVYTDDTLQANNIALSWITQNHQNHIDYYICGHWHHPVHHLIPSLQTTYINLGDWIKHNSYAEWDGSQLEIKNWEGPTLKNKEA